MYTDLKKYVKEEDLVVVDEITSGNYVRAVVNGISCLVDIDDLPGGGGDISKVAKGTITLTVAGWSGGTSYVVTGITGLSEDNRIDFHYPEDDTMYGYWKDSELRPDVSTKGVETITFLCTTTPANEISVNYTIYNE